jgi:hypothetical protein
MPAPTPDQFLIGFPPPMRDLANRLRDLVKQTLPDSTEQVKVGWKLIGWYVPGKTKPIYAGFIIPHSDHVTLGFEYGVLLDAPSELLKGGNEKLKRVRYLPLKSAKEIRTKLFKGLIAQAAEAALLPNFLRSQLLIRSEESKKRI